MLNLKPNTLKAWACFQDEINLLYVCNLFELSRKTAKMNSCS